MAQAPIRHGSGQDQHESFHKFFECWLVEQNQHLQELLSASKENEQQHQEEDDEDDNGLILRQKITGVIEHYEKYYRAKSSWVQKDVLPMFNPPWRSSLEDAFLWIGGWRPSTAFHLLYSKSGLQLEARFQELIQGLTTGDLGDLSSTQLNQVNELQKVTIREEKEITEKLAKQQETVADSSMVELSHAVTESMREAAGSQAEDQTAAAVVDGDRIEATLAEKEEGLGQVLLNADNLRLKTLKEVLNILSPIQGVHFLIAAAELHLRLHEWGKKREARQHDHQAAGEVGPGDHQH